MANWIQDSCGTTIDFDRVVGARDNDDGSVSLVLDTGNELWFCMDWVDAADFLGIVIDDEAKEDDQ